jgi:protein SCO1/2
MNSKIKLFLGILLLAFAIWATPKIIKKFNQADLAEMGNVPEFSLTNQHKKTITDKDYLGKVYVVEFFFSTCPTICPIMNRNMLTVEKEFLNEPNFGIVSITINPYNDTPEVLKAHAEHLGVTHKNWNFLSGDKDYIYELANKGFNLYAEESTKFKGGFEHSGLFALVDKYGKIRCRKDANNNPILYYDGLEESGIKMLKEDIKKLLTE